MAGRISGPETGPENDGLRVSVLQASRRSLTKKTVCDAPAN